MTIEELRERKKELMAQKKEQLELQEQGKGDNFTLFFINEELLDVSAQLRALMPSKRVGRNRTSSSAFASDHQQFVDWTRQDAEEEADDARAEMRRLVQTGIDALSYRQREVLLLWCGGMGVNEIAAKLGVDKSTASRTLNRAKTAAAKVCGTRLEIDRLRDGNMLDLSNQEVAKILLSALTPHQAVCFYLYFAECLTLRQIGDLLGVDHSSIGRTTQRAIARINDVLGCEVDILDNAEGLDEVVFAIYCGLCEQSDSLPPAVTSRIKYKRGVSYTHRSENRRGRTEYSVKAIRFRVRTRRGLKRGAMEDQHHGKLFQALRERYHDIKRGPEDRSWSHPIARWLVKVFRSITNLRDGHSKTGGD